MTAYHLPAGKAAGGPYVVDVNPEKAGWGYSSLRVLELPPGGSHASPPATASGSCCR